MFFSATINLDDYQPRTTRQSKIWLSDVGLTQSDKEVLLGPTGWLTDTIVNAAQQLLAHQFLDFKMCQKG